MTTSGLHGRGAVWALAQHLTLPFETPTPPTPETLLQDGGLEHHQRAASPANIGIMLIRHTAKELTTQWVEVLKREDYWCVCGEFHLPGFQLPPRVGSRAVRVRGSVVDGVV